MNKVKSKLTNHFHNNRTTASDNLTSQSKRTSLLDAERGKTRSTSVRTRTLRMLRDLILLSLSRSVVMKIQKNRLIFYSILNKKNLNISTTLTN